MSNQQNPKMSNKPKSNIASKIPTSGRDSGTHSRSSSVSNLTTTSDLHSEIGDVASDNTGDFKIDERVYVNGTKPGYIKFIGKTEFAPGIWAGILLDEPVGKNDGSVAGIKYFVCEPMRGIFARPAKLTRTAGAISSIGDSAMIGSMTTPSKSTVPSSRASVISNVSSSGLKSTKLRVGDRITVSSLSGLKSGTLRFIGETEFAKGEWAGIELDEPTGKNDGSVAGKRYFTCEMKYGLFAPLHKVSRPGSTPVSRPGSVRGTPLLRSSSRDSLNSSVSNSSRASRVKLGITSLTTPQKGRVSTGMGITSTTKAFEEAIKEKDQHIEQLLKERELDRGEFAKLANHFNQVEVKLSELEKKQKLNETEKKSLEEQLTIMQKKLEDIQFQLEEERISKAEFESQLQQKCKILKNIEEHISKDEGKFLNIKEILSGQEILSEIGDVHVLLDDSRQFEEKIAELEDTVKLLSKEKSEVLNQLTELQNCTVENSTKNEILIKKLNEAIQEKDDMIINLKNELNSTIEKVSHLIEDNKNLSEQILLKEEQAKGHADDVIKELGEKINTLNEQLKLQSSQLVEYIATIEDKENKIKTLEHNLKDKVDALLQLQAEYKYVCDTLKVKESEFEENIAAKKYLETTVKALKSEVETHNDENHKKISLLEEEIKTKSDLLISYLSSIEEKENLISSLQQNFDSQASSLSQLQNEKRDLSESLNLKELELGEKAAKIKFLEEQIASLTAQNISSSSETEKKMLDLVKQIETLTNSVQEKEDNLLKTQSELNASLCTIDKLNETIQQLSEKLQQADFNLVTTSKEANEKISNFEEKLSALNQEKSDMKLNYEKEISSLKSDIKILEDELQTKSDSLAKLESQVSLLTENLKKSNDENSLLKKETGDFSEQFKELSKKKEILEVSLKEKDQIISDFTKQVEELKNSLDKCNFNIENTTKELQALQASFDEKEQENNQLISKLQLAEQKVEMLNKDSSDHVMALQNELSKLKEESTNTKTHLEQELSKIKNENEKLIITIKEKDCCLVEKETIIASLEEKLKERDSTLSDLSLQNANMLSKYNSEVARAKQQEEEISRTVYEYQTKLSEKEKELLNFKNNNEKLLSSVNEKERALCEKEEIVTSLENKLKNLETTISDLSTKNADLLKNIMDLEKEQETYQEKLSNSTVEFENKLKEKDQIIQDVKNELRKHAEVLENKIMELNNKDGEINVLKNVIREKELQFNELSEMVESSQHQLTLLKELNEKNESLLQSNELFNTNFKVEQEKQLQLKEQGFKEEMLKLESLISSKNEEIICKESCIQNLMNEIQGNKKLIDSLQSDLEAAKANNKKFSDVSSNIEELNNRIKEMEEKYSKLLEEKEKIHKEELQTKTAKNNLELMRDTLLQEKCAQEEIVKDREAKLQALQNEVNRMQIEFSQHKQELQQKLDVSEMELQATLELKSQLDIQHSVIEELQQELQKSDETCKKLEAQMQIIPVISAEKNQLQAQVDEFQKVNKERSELISKMEEKCLILEEQLKNNKNLILQKEKEVSNLREQLQNLPTDKVSSNLTLKSLEDENLILKNKITLLESEKKSDMSNKELPKNVSSEEVEERESLLSQIDFLNSIIVDLKQKNEKLTEQLEAQITCWEENDVNLNETKKAIAPRLFCDICEVFDLHETDDCPKQESFVEEAAPQLRRAGTRQLEERPYCNNCEVFGHWTLDCNEPETF